MKKVLIWTSPPPPPLHSPLPPPSPRLSPLFVAMPLTQLDIACQEQEVFFLLKGQNFLSVTKVIYEPSLNK